MNYHQENRYMTYSKDFFRFHTDFSRISSAICFWPSKTLRRFFQEFKLKFFERSSSKISTLIALGKHLHGFLHRFIMIFLQTIPHSFLQGLFQGNLQDFLGISLRIPPAKFLQWIILGYLQRFSRDSSQTSIS